MKKIILIIVLIFVCLHGKAQQRFSLKQCIEYAFSQNFDVKLKGLRAKQSENTLQQSRNAVYPNASGSFSQGLNSGRSIDPFTNNFVQRTISSNSFGVNANFTIFNGFSLKNQIIQNQFEAEADYLDIQQSKNDLRNRVTLAFMQVLMNQELLKIAQEQIQNIQSQYNRIKALVNEGSMPKTNLIDLDAQLSTAEFEVLNAKNNIQISKLDLSQLMIYSNHGEFEIENKPIELQNIILNDSYVQNAPSAIAVQPIVKVNEMRLKSANIGLKLAESGKYPTISFNAGLGTAYSSAASIDYNYFSQLGFNLNQFARLSVNAPIYSNRQVQSKIANAQINQKIVETQLSQAKFQVNQEIQKAYLVAKISQEKLQSAQRQVSAQQIAFDSAQGRYLEGLLHTIELNTFRTNLEKAKSNFVQAKYEFFFRKQMLDFYLN